MTNVDIMYPMVVILTLLWGGSAVAIIIANAIEHRTRKRNRRWSRRQIKSHERKKTRELISWMTIR